MWMERHIVVCKEIIDFLCNMITFTGSRNKKVKKGFKWKPEECPFISKRKQEKVAEVRS